MLAAVILPLALVIDWLFGEPKWLYSRMPHPIVVMGNLAAWVERHLNRGKYRFAKGLVGWLLVVGLSLLLGIALQWVALAVFGLAGYLVLALIASAFIAYKSLAQHVQAVQSALAESLDAGRHSVSMIVGRDTATLDESGVARASIESLAENFSDGVIAPLFWLAVGGLPGLIAYKAINTLDSMWGHRSERYERFGKVAARLDDVANWIPARIAALVIVIACGFSRSASARQAAKAAWRDASQHASPNAGWPEAALAGGMGILLGGPRRYSAGSIDAPYIGLRGGKQALDGQDIYQALRLYKICGFVSLGLCVAVALVTFYFTSLI